MEEGWKRGAKGRMAGPQLHGHVAELSGRGVEEGCRRKNGRASTARSYGGAGWKRGGKECKRKNGRASTTRSSGGIGWKRGANGRMAGPQLHSHLAELGGKG